MYHSPLTVHYGNFLGACGRLGSPAGPAAGKVRGSLCRCAAMLAAMFMSCFASGCAMLAEDEICRIEATHGVSIEVTPAAAANDLLGGNSLVLLWNIDEQLGMFPLEFKRGMTIRMVGALDLLAASRTLGDVLSTPLMMAAVEDRPGKTQGDIYVLNKDLWGAYVDAFQPDTTAWQDPHLRHELIHAYEVNALAGTLFVEKWQRVLNERLGEPDEIRHKLAYIDSISLLAGRDEIASRRFRPYVEFCARWMAAAYGDVNADGLVDERDRQAICRDLARFDINDDGKISYEDAAALSGLTYSFASGIDPVTQFEMTAGMFGYRPSGFASPYGRTSPWEDKAETLAYALRDGLLPALYAGIGRQEVDRAWRRLADIRKHEPVFARKIEILALFLGSLQGPQCRNARFGEVYAGQITCMRPPAAPGEGG